MYWYRLQQGLGLFSVVGTTLKRPEHLPKHPIADEKHSCVDQGNASTSRPPRRKDCYPSGHLLLSHGSQIDLENAYGVFASDAQSIAVDYAPETVHTHGWPAMQQAWKALFNQITVILCFLHAFLKIWDQAKKSFGKREMALGSVVAGLDIRLRMR